MNLNQNKKTSDMIQRAHHVMAKVWKLLTKDSYRPLFLPKTLKVWVVNEIRNTRSKIRRTLKSPRLLTLNIILAVVLNLGSPLLTHSPVFADPEPIPNEEIYTDERGDALFINKNPNFIAEFGTKSEPGNTTVEYTVTAENLSNETTISLEFVGTGIIDTSALSAVRTALSAATEPIPPNEGGSVPPSSDGLDLEEFKSSSAEDKIALLEQEVASLSDDTNNIVTRLDKEIDVLENIRDEERARQSTFKLKTKQQAAIDFGAENTNILSAVSTELSSATTPSTEKPSFNQEHEKAVVVSENITDGIDLVYEILENKGIKESIVIKEATVTDTEEGPSTATPNTFTFQITLDEGVKVSQSINGLWGFTDSSGNYIAHIAKPFMLDSLGRRSNNVAINIVPSVDSTEIRDSSYEIRITADTGWLNDPARVFPINIDPTILHDAQADFTVGEEQRVSVSSDPTVTVDYPTLPADAHTAGLWHFEDNVSGDGQTITDSSANGNDGTTSDAGASGMDCTVTGQVGGYACDFDGSDDFIATTYTTSIGTGPFSMEAWVKMDDANQVGALVAKRPGTTNQIGMFVCSDDSCSGSGQLLSVYEEGGGTIRNAVGTTDIADGTWHHVAVVRDHVSIRAYIDGVLEGEEVGTAGDIDSTQRVTIGNADNTFASDEFDGSIDEVAIHTRALTDDEIKAHASRLPHGTIQSGIIDLGDRVDILESLQWSEAAVATGDGETVVDDAGLVGEWLLNETSGTTVNNSSTSVDSCGAACDGTLNGVGDTSGQDVAVGSGWTSDNGLWPASAPAGLMLDGTDDDITISDDDSLDISSAFTVEAWINPHTSDNGGGDVIVGKGSSGYNYLLYFHSSNDNTPKFFATGLSTTAVVATEPLPTNKWTYVVGTYDGSNLKIYLNGEENNSASATGSATTNSSGLGIGAAGAGNFNVNKSIIDSVRVWSRALSADEITAQFNRTNVEFQTRTGAFDGSGDYTWEAWSTATNETTLESFDNQYLYDNSTEYLVGYYPLNETSGTYVNDVSTTSADGTAVNGASITGGVVENARRFDGSNDYVTFGRVSELEFGVDDPHTISLWARWPSSASGVDTVFSYGEVAGGIPAGGDAGYYIDFDDGLVVSEGVFVDYYDGAGYARVKSPANAIQRDTWHHIVYSYDGSNLANGLSIFIDGVEQSASTEGGSMSDIDYSDSNVSIGARAGVGNFQGSVDEVLVYSTELSANEIIKLYQKGSARYANDLGGVQQFSEETIHSEGVASTQYTFGAPKCTSTTTALWHLDEIAGTRSDSCNGINLSVNDTDASDQGFFGRAAYFDGTNDFLESSDTTLDPGTSDFSFAAWVYPTTLPAVGTIVETGATSGGSPSNAGYWIHSSSADVFVKFSDATGSRITSSASSALRINTWTHLVVNFDRDGNQEIFINGVSQDSDAISAQAGNITPADEFTIGSLDSATNEFNGNIDEVIFQKSLFTQEEIAALYRAGRDHHFSTTISSADLAGSTKVPVSIAADRPGTYLELSYGESEVVLYDSDENTVGLWHLNEDSAYCTASETTCVKDASGNHNHGTPGSAPSDEAGALGRAWHFDASDDYITISDSGSLDLDGGSMSIAAWIKTGADAADNVILSKGASYEIGVNATGALYWDGAGAQADNGGTSILANEWHHVVVTNNDTTASYYVNGVLTGTDSAGIDTDNNDPLLFGHDGTNYFDGLIDEVMIRNDALTADQVRQMYERGKRSHPVTIDFVAELHSDDLITSSSDTSFEIDATTYGAVQQGDNLYVGDTVIVREFDTGIEYLAQGEVYSVVHSSGAVDVETWDAQSTFPSGGFSAGATVMKWQEEWIDIPNDLRDEDADAITQLTWRVTDANQGATFWLDNLRHSTGYLTGNANCTTSCTDDITSTRNRYLQYRGILSSSLRDTNYELPNTSLTPELSEVRVVYADTVGLDDLTTASFDTEGNKHLGSNNVNDVHFYDRSQDQFSYALEFDGSNDYVSVGDDDSLTFATGGVDEAFTFEAWINPTDATDAGILSKRTSGTLEYVLTLEENDYLRLALYDGSANRIAVESTSTLTAYEDSWIHVAGTYDGTESSGGLSLYLNGEALATTTDDFGSYTGMTDTSEPFYIGIDQAGGSSDYFSGKIDEIAIFSDERTAAEIASDYAARRIDESDTTTYDNLVSVWHFDEGSAHGSTVSDSKGNNFGSMINMDSPTDWVWSEDERDQSPLSQQALGVDPNWGNGVVRQSTALEFDGSNDYAQFPLAAFDATNDPWTIQGWFKTTDTTNPVPLIYNAHSTGGGGIYINLGDGVSTGTVVALIQTDSGAGFSLPKSTRSYNDGKWHMVTFIRTGDRTTKLYVDGILEAEDATGTGSGTAITLDRPWYFAKNQDSGVHLEGSLDEWAFFNDVRTASEITEDFRNRRVDDDEGNIAALFHFDEGAMDTCSGGTNDICESTGTDDGLLSGMDSADWVTGPYALQDNNAQYIKLGTDSSVDDDSSYEIHLDTETTFKYRTAGASSWTTPSPATLSSYTFASPAQIDSTGVYVGFDTSNGIFSEEDHFDIHSWAIESFSNTDAGEAMRGSLNRFPEKSYIVSQNDFVDIIDAETNNVWMRLPQGSSYALGETTNDLGALAVAHGKIHVGNAADGFYTIDYTSDSFYRNDEVDRRSSDQDIADRTATNTYGSADVDYALAGDDITTVSTAVIQGQEFIATGYDESASITAMTDQTVVDFIIDSQGGETDDDVSDIVLLPNGDLYATSCAGAGTPCDVHAYYDIWNDSADETSFGENRDAIYDSSSTPSLLTSVFYDLDATAGTSLIDGTSNTLYVGTDAGMMVLQEKQTDEANGSVKQHSKDFITEEMIGDVQLMLPLTEDPAGGGTFTDRSAQGNDLTLTDSDNDSTTTGGVRGKAFNFNGDGDYGEITDNASLSTGDIDFTFGGWVKADSIPTSGNYNGVISKDSSASTREYHLIIDGDQSRFLFQVYGSSDTAIGAVWADSIGDLSADTWYFVVVWHDATANTVNIQVNGGSVDSEATTGTPQDDTAPFRIGTYYTNRHFDGAIDEVFFTKEILTSDQRERLYRDGLKALTKSHSVDDTFNELAENSTPTDRVSTVQPLITYNTGTSRAYNTVVGTNNTGVANDGALSILDGTSNILSKSYLDSGTEPAIVDSDVASVSCSNDGVYCIVGAQNAGITILYSQGDAVTSESMRHGKTFGSGRERPGR